MPGDTGAERRRLRLDGGEPRSLQNPAPVPGHNPARAAGAGFPPGDVMCRDGDVMGRDDVMRPIAGDVMPPGGGVMHGGVWGWDDVMLAPWVASSVSWLRVCVGVGWAGGEGV